MVKDCNGKEINIGDKIKHVFGPWSEFYLSEHQKDPKNPKWLSDGFAGVRTVHKLHTNAVMVNRIDSCIPSYLGCYCEVVEV